MTGNNGHGAERRRVVVTGLGVVAPNGNGVDAFCQALRDGRSGVHTITCFNPEGLTCRVAGEVRDFRYLLANDLERLGRGDYIPNHAMPRTVDVSLCNCIGFGSKNSAQVISAGEFHGWGKAWKRDNGSARQIRRCRYA